MVAPSKQRLVFGVFLLILIVALELVLHGLHLPTWPAFLVMIFFFEAHMDKGRAPHLIVGGLVGILCYLFTVEFVSLAGPIMGMAVARLVFICVVVYAIVALGESLPMIFNNYAFMFFLVSGLAARAIDQPPQPLLWILVELVGGLVVVGGVLAIGKLMTKLFSTEPATH